MEDTISIRVKISSKDEAVEVSAPKTQSVAQLKHQIAAVSSIPADRQRLIYKGKLLKDGDTLESAGMEDGNTLHVAPIGVSASVAPTTGSAAAAPPTSAPTPAPAYAPNHMQLIAFDRAMRTLLGNPEAVAKEAVTVLHKIVSNIHDHPMEDKYRRLKKSNATFNRKLGGLAGGIDALKAAGFTENGDDLTLYPSPELWPVIVAVKSKLDALAARMNTISIGATAAPAPATAPASNTTPGSMIDPATLQQFLQGLHQLQAQQQQEAQPQSESGAQENTQSDTKGSSDQA